jgi:hypothetical protein
MTILKRALKVMSWLCSKRETMLRAGCDFVVLPEHVGQLGERNVDLGIYCREDDVLVGLGLL